MEQGQAELELRLQAHVSELASRSTQLEASRAALRTLTRRLVEVQEEERRSLARDLHDTSSPALTVIGLGLSVLRREYGCTGTMRTRIDELQRVASTAAEDLHRLSANLRPGSLDQYGLVPASEELITSLSKQTQIDVEFRVEGLEERLPDELETALYRIIQEACTNISRYAAASHASVSMWRRDDAVQLRVEDDGRGFDVVEALGRGRLGLLGMRERAEMLGGYFTVTSSPGQGTTLLVEVPVTDLTVKLGVADGPDPTLGEARGHTQTVAPVDPAVSSEAAELARVGALSDAMVEIMAGMSRHDNAQELLAFVLARSAAAVGCDYAVIGLRAGSRWTVSHAYGLPESMVGRRLLPAAVPLAQEVERTSDVVVVNNTYSGDRLAVAARESGVFSGAGLPLLADGRFLGAVAFVHNSAPIRFKPSEVAFLKHLSSVISLVLENIQFRGVDQERGSAVPDTTGNLSSER